MTEYIVFLVLTALAAVWDGLYKKIPNGIVFPGMVLGICFSTLRQTLAEHLMGLVILFLMAYFAEAFIRNRIGMGDWKLWMMCEAFTGIFPSFLIFTVSQFLLLSFVLIKGKGVKVWHGLKTILFYRVVPEGTEKYSLGTFFLMAALLCLPLAIGGKVP